MTGSMIPDRETRIEGTPGSENLGARSRRQLQDAADHREILKKTYLFLRFGLVGTGIAIFLAVVFTPSGYLPDGEATLPSISHYYYTPARIVFTGALCAAALALVVISGKGVQSYLLDLAALMAPLIAIIPTPTAPGEVGREAQLGDCPDGGVCIPADQFPYVATGFQVWLWMTIGVLSAAFLWGLYQRFAKARHFPKPFWVILCLAFIVWFAYLLLWSIPDQEMLRRFGHVAAACLFSGLIITVAVIEAWRQWADRYDPTPPPPPAYFSRPVYAGIYLVLGLIMSIDIVVAGLTLAVWFSPAESGAGNAVFIVEAVGLAAFAAFWVVQTAEHARDSDGWEPLGDARARRRAQKRADQSSDPSSPDKPESTVVPPRP
jgi:hypothetical protein